MKNNILTVLAMVATNAIAIGAPARMSISEPSSRPQQLAIQGAPAGTRLRIVDGVKELGVVVGDRSGRARLNVGALSSGSHTIRALKWGTGEPAVEPLRFSVPAWRAGRLAPSAKYEAGIYASLLASGDLHGDGLTDLVLGSPSGIYLIHNQDGVLSAPHPLEWSAGSEPTAITVFDANGDGLNDLAITRADGRTAILLNRGGDAFSAAHYYMAGAHPSSIVTADFNGDGIPDLAVANQDGNNISILYGKGDGTFQPAMSVPSGYSPRALVVADFNGDGIPDLATANFATNDVSILLGDGHGAFLPGGACGTGHGPLSLAVADFNEDGAPDLAVHNLIDGTVSVLLNDGAAAFRSAALVAAASSPITGVVAGDVDGDGRADLVLHAGGEIQTWLGSGDGSFAQGYSLQTTASPLLVAFQDLNQDGFADVTAIDVSGEITVLSGAAAPAEKGGMTHSITRSGGGINSPPGELHLSPRALQSSSIVLTSSSSSIAFGKYVTLTATLTPSNATGRVVFYDGTTLLGMRLPTNGTASLTTNLLPSGSRSLRAYYDGNSSYTSSTSTVFAQTVTDQTAGFQPLVNNDTPSGPYAVAVGDFNGDGKADLAVANSGFYPGYAGSVAIYLGFGDGTYQAPAFYPTGVGSSYVVVADFNEDGAQDLAVANWVGTVSVLLGNGNGTFRAANSYTVGSTPYALAVGDFTGNGRASLAVANNGDNNVTLLLGNGDGTFVSGGLLSAATAPESIVTGDFNKDGITDLAVAGSDGVAVLLGAGGARFNPSVKYPAGSNSYSVATADFNGDGVNDLAVANLNSGNVSVLIGNGDGTFRTPVNYSTGVNAESVAVGDLNGDGVTDLAVANFGPASAGNGSLTVLYGNGNGTFRSPLTYAAGGTPFFVAVGNLNGDVSSDLAVINLNGNSVGVLLGMPSAEGPPTAATTPSVNVDSLASGDTVSGTIAVSGWAIDNTTTLGTAIGNVQIKVDGAVVGTATYGGARPDVCTAYPGRAGCPNVGFTYQLNTALLTSGAHVITASATDTDNPPATGSFSLNVIVTGGTQPPLPPPTVNVDSLASGATVSGTVTVSGWAIDSASGTAIGSVQVKVDGAVVGTATYGGARPDVCTVYPGRAGCPNVGFTYQLNTASLSAGSHTITVVATDTDTIPDSGSFSLTVTVQQLPPPTVHVDSLTSGATISGTVTVYGWAIDSASGTAIGSVQVKVDGTVVGNATYGGARPDVCGVYPGRVGCPNVGFTYQLNTASLSAGLHTITVVATDTDTIPDSGSFSLTVTVAGVPQLPPPTVVVDSLASGATILGTVTVSGWAIDSASGTAIGSVQVKVDGTVVGTATYGVPRPDVCGVYPGRAGCPNVGFTYQLSTASLSPGNHTITVVATDTDSTPDSGSFSLTVNVMAAPLPMVAIDSLTSGATVSGIVTVSGWAIDIATAISSVQVLVDGIVVGTATYGMARPDVCTVYPGRPKCPNVGFTYQLNTASLNAGPHTITVVATDTDAIPDSGSFSLTVNSLGAPSLASISSISAVTSQTTVTITWTTDQPADSQVEYGLTTAYGSLSPLNPTLTTSHSVQVSNLVANTLYHYRINSRNAAGSLALSPDQTITTQATTISTAPVSVFITYPANNDVVANIASVAGTATANTAVASVSVSVDSGPYSVVTGTSLWYYGSLYAKLLPVGPHTVTVKAVDTLGNAATSTITVNVARTNPICSHSSVGSGIFCEQTAVGGGSTPQTSITFPHGYTAGNLIVVGVSANDQHVPWVPSSISNTAGYSWKFWGNATSGILDDDLVQVAIYYAYVPATTNASDTITVSKPSSTFTVEDAVVYSGVGAIDGPGSSLLGWGGPGVGDASTGNYPVSVGDLNVGFVVGAPTFPGSGWTERAEDFSRPFTEFSDQIATSTVANATWKMNPEGYVAIGVAFKPAQ